MLFLIISFTVVFIIYLTIRFYYLQGKRKINNKRMWTFTEERKKYFFAVEIVLIVLFLISVFISVAMGISKILAPFMVSGLLLLISISQAIEEWIYYRKDKVYYHRILQSFALLSFIILCIVEQFIL